MAAKSQRGFSLIELMVTVVVASILLAVAVPNMRKFMQRNRVANQSNNIMADLTFARGQAASTRSYVSICPRANTTDNTCDTTTGNYDKGWIIYTAAAPNTEYKKDDPDAAARLLRVTLVASAVSIRASAVGPLTYNGRGELLTPTPLTADMTVTTCSKASTADADGTNTTDVPGAQLMVSHSGRVATRPLASGTVCT
ncbi:GspH/FimT family pseudopilin [Pinirhizobacter sp.]|jgi:type IV fimbrial biogenesis protein FimT|uniref:GspH/FimT family pseudopilin n=1 Tax=Pinirhizobacter sp. TaxID=2950432 RepID=UPI002F40AA93